MAGLVVAAIPPSPADEALQGRLEALGYVVLWIDDDAALTTDAAGFVFKALDAASAFKRELQHGG